MLKHTKQIFWDFFSTMLKHGAILRETFFTLSKVDNLFRMRLAPRFIVVSDKGRNNAMSMLQHTSKINQNYDYRNKE